MTAHAEAWTVSHTREPASLHLFWRCEADWRWAFRCELMPGMLSSRIYQNWVRPALFRLDPEIAHEVVMALLERSGPLMEILPVEHPAALERKVFGITFPNPVGLAAGLDKNAVALPAWAALGFGFVEAGTITAQAQLGNPKPRLVRLPEQRALINRMGFNNDGAAAIAARLQALRERGGWPAIPVGINIGKTRVVDVEQAPADYAASFRALRDYGDYFVVNVSSPNTPGLRTLQDRDALGALLSAVQAENLKGKPVLVKIAPDLEWPAIEEIISVAEAHGVAGFVATNTTLDHSSVPPERDAQGGLSGAPLRQRSTEIVRFLARHTQLGIIAAGGIDSTDAAREKLNAGAALVQLYTGFIYEGPGLVREICKALLQPAPSGTAEPGQ
jgi:dihydroorotate dehydrogenase